MPIEGLKNLRFLHLKENPIQDITPIRRLRKQIPNLELDIEVAE